MLRALLAAALALATGFAGTAAIAEAGKIAVEFNDLQQSEAGCRAVFVLNNGLDKPLDKVTLRVVAFDAESHAKLFLSLDVGALPIGKTRVLRFDLGADLACKDVSRIVLDDVTSCEGAEMAPPECLAAISLSSRAGAPFDF
jgi:hypothetical protein